MNDSNRHFPLPPRGFVLAVAALILCFALPLYRLARFALHSDLSSYILLVPVISLGMVWLKRPFPPPPSSPNRKLAVLLLAAGAAAPAAFGLSVFFGMRWPSPDSLAVASLSFSLLLAGLCAWFLGRRTVRAIAFPLAFLVFMAPLPVSLANSLETFLQHTSAAVAYLFFDGTGMPVLRRGALGFQLPGMNLQVAPQCSGLHSSLALFIVSLPAGYLFLRSPWKRAALSAAVIPVGIVRNGFRIFTIGELCVRIGPQMIDSYLHRTGGWIFFLLALGPFFILLFLLMQAERPAAHGEAKPGDQTFKDMI